MTKKEIKDLRKPEVDMVSGGTEIAPGTNIWEMWPFGSKPPWTSLDGDQ